MRGLITIFAMSALPALLGISGTITPSGAVRIDSAVNDAMRDSVTPGASVAVAINGAVVFVKGYGKADSRGMPVTPETVFQMGSITKQFVAAAIMQLVEARTVNIDAPVGRYVREFAAHPELTIRNLLRQSSGLTEYNTLQFRQNEIMVKRNGSVDRSPLLKHLAGLRLRFAPGTKYEYSNTNYLVLGEVVARATGIRFERVLRERVFAPAGMSHSAAGSQQPPGVVSGGFTTIFGFSVPMVDWNLDWLGGAGSLRSTPLDLVRWDDALFGGRIVSQRSVAQMTTPYKGEYGFGLAIQRLKSGTLIWHNGATSNAHSMLIRYLPQNVTIAVVGSTQKFPAEAVAGRIARVIDPSLLPRTTAAARGPLHVRRNGIIGLLGALLPLLTLIVARRGRWRWIVAPLLTCIMLIAGVLAPLYIGIAGLIAATLLLTPSIVRIMKTPRPGFATSDRRGSSSSA
jgi:CubicO group peptidase (beta-lactamase class C family)